MPWPMAREALQPSACMELSSIPLTVVRAVGIRQFYYRQIHRSPSTVWPMAMGCSLPLDITNRLSLSRSELSTHHLMVAHFGFNKPLYSLHPLRRNRFLAA